MNAKKQVFTTKLLNGFVYEYSNVTRVEKLIDAEGDVVEMILYPRGLKPSAVSKHIELFNNKIKKGVCNV